MQRAGRGPSLCHVLVAAGHAEHPSPLSRRYARSRPPCAARAGQASAAAAAALALGGRDAAPWATGTLSLTLSQGRHHDASAALMLALSALHREAQACAGGGAVWLVHGGRYIRVGSQCLSESAADPLAASRRRPLSSESVTVMEPHISGQSIRVACGTVILMSLARAERQSVCDCINDGCRITDAQPLRIGVHS